MELLRRVRLVGHRDEVFASLPLVVEAVLLAGEGRNVMVVVGTPGALQVTHVHLWGRRLQRTPQRRPKHLGVLGGVVLGRRARGTAPSKAEEERTGAKRGVSREVESEI